MDDEHFGGREKIPGRFPSPAHLRWLTDGGYLFGVCLKSLHAGFPRLISDNRDCASSI
jgi:hypothetical protein